MSAFPLFLKPGASEMPERRVMDRGEYFGQERARVSFEKVIVTDKIHPAESVLPPHEHRNPYCCIPLSGHWREHSGSGDRTCRPGMVIFHPAGEMHSDAFREETGRTVNVEFEASALSDLEGSARCFSRPFAAQDHELHWLGSRLVHALEDQEPGRRLVVHGIALEILGRIAGRDPKVDTPPNWLEQARDLIRDCCTDAVQIADIAQEVGVHPVHLARRFRRHFGLTPGTYLRNVRTERALADLRDTDRAIAEIALDAGFSDQPHLTRVVKRHIGMTPGQYRRAHR